MSLVNIAQVRVNGFGGLVVLEFIADSGELAYTITLQRSIAIQIGHSMAHQAVAGDVLNELLEQPPPAPD